MDKIWLVYVIRSYEPKLSCIQVVAYDVYGAISASGQNINEIVSVKLKDLQGI